jgi:hypothetical protein
MATLQSTSFTNLTLPSGPTADRYGSPSAGMTRYNSTIGTIEHFDGTTWRPVTGISKGTIGSGGDSIQYVGNTGSRASGGIVHVYTTVQSTSFTPAFTGTVEILVVAGGGSGGAHWGGGGGGGGVIYNRTYPVSSGTPISITVGGGGAKSSFPNAGSPGGNSVFGSVTASGGGAGGSWYNQGAQGNTGQQPGGSGGGSAMVDSPDSRYRVQPVPGIAGQGFPGGASVRYNQQGDNCHMSGGGGGSGGNGRPGPDYCWDGRVADGGPGAANDILGSILYWGGGGAGCCYQGNNTTAESGGIGGGGGSGKYHGGPRYPNGPFSNGMGGGQAYNAGQPGIDTNYAGNAGANTGGGGGGSNYNYTQNGTQGGSGIVIVRY